MTMKTFPVLTAALDTRRPSQRKPRTGRVLNAHGQTWKLWLLSTWTMLLALGFAHEVAVAQGAREVVIDTAYKFRNADWAIDENGAYFAVAQVEDGSTGREVRVYRSDDHGETWRQWGRFWDTDSESEYLYPSVTCAQGPSGRLLVAMVEDPNDGVTRSRLCVYAASTDASFPTWSRTVVGESSSEDYRNPDIETDAAFYDDYNVYLVYERSTGWGAGDIHFARSTDFGSFFSHNYPIIVESEAGSLTSPVLSYGFGDQLHVIARRVDITDGTGISMRRGFGRVPTAFNWFGTVEVEASGTGVSHNRPWIAASKTTNDVYASYSRNEGELHGVFLSSTDGGVTFSDREDSPTVPGYYFSSGVNALGEPAVAGCIFNFARPLVPDFSGPWETTQMFDDQGYAPGHPPVVLADPARDDQFGMVGIVWHPDEAQSKLRFYGEWRTEPEWPVYQSTIPLVANNPVVAPAALIDVNGDMQMEFVHVTQSGHVWMVENDGTPLAGWPVDIGNPVAGSPVAVADIDGDGEVEVVIGNDAGQVHAFALDGTTMPGFPVTVGSDPVHVSIGDFALRGDLTIVAGSGSLLSLVGPDGNLATGFPVAMLGDIEHTCATGDYDNDGTTEIACGHGNRLSLLDSSGSVEWTVAFAADLSDSPTMGDFDFGYNFMEIAVPLENGEMHLLQNDGTSMPGFPWNEPSGLPNTSATFSDVLGTGSHELLWGNKSGAIYSTNYARPDEHVSGFPALTEGPVVAAPITTHSAVGPSHLYFGDQAGLAFGWTNILGAVDGWPIPLDGQVIGTPLSADLDDDGSIEVVFYTPSGIQILDLHSPINNSFIWPLDMANNQRTGSAPAIPVPADSPDFGTLPTASLQLRSANPVHDTASLRLTLAEASNVDLAIFDSTGRRVADLGRGIRPAGAHDLTWNGKDSIGRIAPSGMYFVRARIETGRSTDRIVQRLAVLR